MAKITDVTDVPDFPGAGMLHFDDGRPPLLALPEIADEHRERLGLTDDRLAMTPQQSVGASATRSDALPSYDQQAYKNRWGGTIAPGPPPSIDADSPQGRAIAAQYGAAPQASAAPPPVLNSSQPATGAPVEVPPPSIAAPPAPPGVNDLSQQARDVVAARSANELINGVTGGPARPAGYTPTIEKQTVEAGPAYDPRAAGERLDADRAVLDAQLGQQATAKQIADAAAAKAAADSLAAQHHLAEQQAGMVRRQQDYQDQNQHMERELADYSQSAKPDPDRFFANRAPVANMLSVIGQALGAAGASLGHTQNFAFEYIQSQIKNDIAAQQQEYEAGRADRNNALARFANYYHGDMDLAKLGLQQAMNKVAETETNQFAAQSQSKTISANAAALAAQFQRDSLMREQQKAELAQGKTTTVNEQKFHAAEGGGRRPLTPAEEEARIKLLPKLGKDQGALGLSPQAEARQKAAYSTKTETLATFADSLSHRATLMGIHFDPKTGELTNAKGKPVQEGDLDVPVGAGYVGKHISGDVLTPKAMELRRAEENSVRLHAAAVYDHSISAEEGAQEVDKTIGSTDAAKLANMRYLAEEYRKRKLAIDTGAATIDPRMVNERDQAERNVNLARATGRSLPGPVPVIGNPGNGVDEPETDSP